MSCKTGSRTILDSAEVLSRVRTGELKAVVPGHALTTLYYVIAKATTATQAGQTVDWLLAHFEVGAVDTAVVRRARQLAFGDFEDAVVASVAEVARCDYVVTRNAADFADSPIPAITPVDLLALLPPTETPPGSPGVK